MRSIQNVDVKCDKILGMLNVISSDSERSLIGSLKASARDMYLCSIEERRRSGKVFDIMKHD